jgi:chaperonin cofactor prefoldin
MAGLKNSAELMAATQKNLVDFLRTDLAICETLAAVAETELGLNRQHAVQAFNKAVRGCEIVGQFVMKVQESTAQREIEESLTLLESRLATLEAALN